VSGIEFGIFDHVTRPPGVALDELYEGRLALLRRADAAGFRGYHLAEHHGHALSATPSQALFLAAVARETEHLRLGMLVACLPLHHPIRLVEEICMLDQLSGGRLDLGVGRGISPFEHRLFGHDPDESRDRFAELLPMVVQGLSTGRMDSGGSAHYDFPEIELPVAPAQRPYPPMWAAGNVEAAARNGLNVVSGAPVSAEGRRRYDELWAESRRDPERLNPHVETPLVGSSQYVCIADTDDEARRIGERALGVLAAFLGRSIGREPPHLQDPDRPEPPTPLVKAIQSRAAGVLVCGTAETVRDHYVRYAAEGAVNYIVINVPFGDMTHAEAERTLDAFVADVMPAVREAARTSPAA
jgi:alkanesulfonate monooxygenase SsuD/methylene tetrahydromethanopterin reductase-like flavin-dependent oxidoreductase (luciferase family)